MGAAFAVATVAALASHAAVGVLGRERGTALPLAPVEASSGDR
jgi:hypothetical protein